MLNFPFNGDEMALRNMELPELITISTLNGMCLIQVPISAHLITCLGSPAMIRPGKPVYKYFFERVVDGEVFCQLLCFAITNVAITRYRIYYDARHIAQQQADFELRVDNLVLLEKTVKVD